VRKKLEEMVADGQEPPPLLGGISQK